MYWICVVGEATGRVLYIIGVSTRKDKELLPLDRGRFDTTVSVLSARSSLSLALCSVCLIKWISITESLAWLS